MAARRNKRIIKKPTSSLLDQLPSDDSDVKFCELWLKYSDHVRAGREMGWSVQRSLKTFTRFSLYLARMQSRKEKELARQAVVGQKHILAELLSLGMANPQDYIEAYEERNAETGQMVTKYRQKDLMSLPRLVAAAISKVTINADGSITYQIPNYKAKIPGLVHAGRHFGMFNDKLIAQHKHDHARASMPSLRGADPALIRQLEDNMRKLMSPEQAKQLLGITVEGDSELVDETAA